MLREISHRHSYHFVVAMWRAKVAESAAMMPWKALAILATLFASIALAEDFKTVDGKEYKNVTVSRVEPDGIVVRSKSGILKLYFTELPKGVQERFHYDQQKAAEFTSQTKNGIDQLRHQRIDANARAAETTSKLEAENEQKQAISRQQAAEEKKGSACGIRKKCNPARSSHFRNDNG